MSARCVRKICKISSAALIIYLLLLIINRSSAQNIPQLAHGPRVALIICNEAYDEAPLENVIVRGQDLAAVLSQGGFEVLLFKNATKNQILTGLEVFNHLLAKGATGIIYYGGHTLQYQGHNFIVPIDFKASKAEAMPSKAIDLNVFFDSLTTVQAANSIVIMNGAKPNPWQKALSSDVQGLAAVEPAKDTTVIFACEPDKLVSAEAKGDEAFIVQLVNAMKTPGLNFDAVIYQTRLAVLSATNNSQLVWQGGATPSSLVIIPANAQVSLPEVGVDATELGFWSRIKDSNIIDYYKTYLFAYPNGHFVSAAKDKIAQIGDKKPSSQSGKNDQKTRKTGSFSKTIQDCSNCPEIVLIPAGKFSMGSTNGFPFEMPVHNVTISKEFYMSTQEITFDEWDACVNEGGCVYSPDDKNLGRGTRPVTNVNWNDAKAYITWLSRKTNQIYRLPTEAEWEYAARAGTKTAYYWGDKLQKDKCNCAGCTSTTNTALETGSFAPNGFGLFDMAGNAAEWVEDCWHDSYKGAPQDGSAFAAQNCREHVLRGGAFNNDPRYVRSAARFKYDYNVRYYANGFRIVREK